MNRDTLQLLRDPATHTPLALTYLEDGTECLADETSGALYPVRNGVPCFLDSESVAGSNRKYRRMYNLLSPFYDFVTRTAIVLMGASEEDVRHEFLSELEIKPGDRVLEVSVGTGSNLRYLPRSARYYGLDISEGQLKQCRKTLKQIGLQADLFLGTAEKLPFEDNSFDVVFHMGGINFFSNPAAAVCEMYRVAKPGTKMIIVDETDRFTKKLAKIPIVRAFFKSDDQVTVPDIYVPEDARDTETKELFNGRLWYLGFRKAPARVQPAAVPTDLLQ
ncbi:MAG: class I SAM-dependent methyltransferase [Bacillota bacterium]|nr:class I SAM-dependent methyltransferase [Bacillota bacterium]MDW7683278.1 class I SAM-dependent methyltransferase [Bacillota bacterium]